MHQIAILPSAVVDQIAAGEVVERPASVVKELVENALDADARSVDIIVEDGGRTRITVADDGFGMRREDALLAIRRHATSKIRDASDLVGVSSFGFRGEALPAIASVSEMEIETSANGGGGTLMRAAGGVITEVRDAARRTGTTVTVSRLFFNAPSRQRFLRSARSEWRAIADLIASTAMVRLAVRVLVSHDGREVMNLPAASSARARVAALWGAQYAECLVEVDDVRGEIHIAGLVERPSDVGTGTRRVHVVVNGRAIRDAGMVRAAEAAYRSTIPAGTRPSILLHISVPADAVDVNVHPAKVEVRFRDRWPVEHAVESAVRRALGTPGSAASIGAPAFWAVPKIAFAAVDVEMLHGVDDESPLLGGGAATLEMVPGTPETEEGILVPPLRQLRHTYIMFERDDGVVLIDQHSAHERVLYERFMHALEHGAEPSQRLLFPLTLHVGPQEGDAFEENREMFERLGYEIEGFGGHTLLVQSVPAPHPRFDAERCLRESLDALTGNRMPGTASRHEKLAATVACKAAIKAGDSMSDGEMRSLFSALARTVLPAHDVHGRSTVVQLPWDEIERRFGRR
ncbi:MAG: DNA mismatch repair endonuclease MutL [Gemmatimonadaceae bacterium]